MHGCRNLQWWCLLTGLRCLYRAAVAGASQHAPSPTLVHPALAAPLYWWAAGIHMGRRAAGAAGAGGGGGGRRGSRRRGGGGRRAAEAGGCAASGRARRGGGERKRGGARPTRRRRAAVAPAREPRASASARRMVRPAGRIRRAHGGAPSLLYCGRIHAGPLLRRRRGVRPRPLVAGSTATIFFVDVARRRARESPSRGRAFVFRDDRNHTHSPRSRHLHASL